MNGVVDTDKLEWRNTLAILQSASRDRPVVDADVRAAAERVVAECLARLRRLQGTDTLPAAVRADVDEALHAHS